MTPKSRPVPLMVGGFSQGGIAAGAFAQDYSGQFNIQQVVTIGAPIARFDIPSTVHVLSYEANDDPVPRLDGAHNDNPELPVSEQASEKSSPVLVAGFSQGGFTAGAFAQDYSGTYKVEQVVTIGANVGRFDIPPAVHVLSYVSKDDPIPRLDGSAEPSGPNVQVIYGDDGGGAGFPASHDASKYANMAAAGPQPDTGNSENLHAFLGSNNSSTLVTNYYAK